MKAPKPQVTSLRDRPKSQEARACFCIGPRNGDPVCPCRMQEHTEREMGRRLLDRLLRGWTPAAKPRVRVKAGSRRVAS